MKTHKLIAISLSALLAASALGADIPEIPSDITWDGTINKKLESGTQSSDYYGGSGITVLGKEDGTGPTFQSGGVFGIGAKNYKFRGAALQMNGNDSHVYIYGGKYYDKVSAVNNTTNTAIAYSSTVNNATGHMYIYGGTFNSDITGLGMAQSGTHTANTDIHILGAITNGAGMGVFGGVSGASGGSASLVGNTSVTVSGSGNTTFIAGGNRMAANITGDVTLSVENGGTVGGILGGNYVHNSLASTSTVDGNISIAVSGFVKKSSSFLGLTDNVINGIIGGGANTNVTGTTSITINSTASVTGGIAGGSAGHTEGVRVENSKIAITGGTVTANGSQKYVGIVEVDNAIVGGNIALGVQQTASYTMGNSQIAISGGTITGDIYGGGIAQGGDYAAFSTVETANITIDATNAVSISGNIYGGGRADTANSTATVGTANIVFKGVGSNLTFTGTVNGNGSGAGTSTTGTSTFTFDGYNGAFAGTIQNFDALVVKNQSAVTGADSGIVKIENIGKVILEDTSTLKLETSVSTGGNLEISGGSLNEGSSVSLTEKASVTVTAASNKAVTLTAVAAGVVISGAAEITSTDAIAAIEAVSGGVVLSAWDFVVENASGGVTVTMDVGAEQKLEDIRIYHEENGDWTDVTDDVGDKSLKDGKLSFTANKFSGYSAVAIPEPSTFGLFAGLGALLLVGARRRRR